MQLFHRSSWIFVLGVLFLSACTPSDEALPTLAVLNTPVPNAQALQFWESQTARLENLQARQYYEFVANANDSIRLGAVENGVAVQLTLRDTLGNVLAQGESIEAIISVNGVYRVEVQTLTDGASEFTLGLSYTDRENPNASLSDVSVLVGVPTPTPDFGDLGAFVGVLNPNITTSNTLSANQQRQVYTFDMLQGQFFSIEMSRISGTLDPEVLLFNDAGQLVAQDDNSAGNRNARLLNVRSDRSQTYRLQVTGKGAFGDYELLLLSEFQTPPADMPPTATAIPITPFITPTLGVAPRETRLTDHAPAIGLVDGTSGFSRYSFYAEQGEIITLGVSLIPGSNFIPIIEVYDPEGAQILTIRAATSNDNGNAYASGIAIQQTGAYLVIVTGESDTQGSFVISYGRGASRIDEFQSLAEPNIRLNGTIDPKGVRDVWLVNLQANDVITAVVTSEDDTIDPLIEVADLNGNSLARDDNSGGGTTAQLRSVTIQQSGQYLLRISTARGDQTGNYTLVWRYINLAPSPTPIPSRTILLNQNGTVADAEYVFFSFYGQAGQVVNVRVGTPDNATLDPIAVLLDPQGNEIAQGDDDEGILPNFNVTLPTEGTYRVRVNGYLSSGEFDAVVTWLR
jgi:hypothetical protein